jgi:DNA helicase HerA-like ATPase
VSDVPGILVAQGEHPLQLLPRLANRHGLVAGATGTGKTVTLQVIAEGFSRLGVPVFLADVKGDLAGISQPGEPKPRLVERAKEMGLELAYAACPVVFWDLFGTQGHPIRTTVSDVGPLLLGRLLDLNDVQSGVLNLAFKLADDEGLLLLDLKDLRAMLTFVAENAKKLTVQYGAVSASSIGAIQRALLVLEQQGAAGFFGEPALDIADLLQVDGEGRGVVSVLAADKLMQSPRLYATFLLWLLSELFERLPEIGDPEKPRLVFFFDEAHLLFDEAPKALVDKVEQVVRLIRSKGVGVYFVTQNPLDVPDAVLGQLGNRIQHALRAFTPRDQKAVKVAADTFRPNPKLDTAAVITELGVGEALVSLLEANGSPAVVERAKVRPPESRLGPVTPAERKAVLAQDAVGSTYDETVDRESAFERLAARASGAQEAAPGAPAAGDRAPWQDSPLARGRDGARGRAEPRPAPPSRARTRESAGEAMVKSVARSVGSQLGRQIVRGLLGSILRS